MALTLEGGLRRVVMLLRALGALWAVSVAAIAVYFLISNSRDISADGYALMAAVVLVPTVIAFVVAWLIAGFVREGP